MGTLAVVAMVGRMVALFGLLMLVPMTFAIGEHDPAEGAFLSAAGITVGCGVLMSLTTRRFKRELAPRDGFVLVTLSWTLLPALGALPLMLALPGPSFTDAYFEAMSGLTTAGATVLTGIEAVATFFTLVAGINVAIYFLTWRRRSLLPLWRGPQVRVYLPLMIGSVLAVALFLTPRGVYPTFAESLRHAAFNVVSIAATTGFATVDYAQWPIFAPPKASLPVTLGGAIVPPQVMHSVPAFMLIFTPQFWRK
jgi:trk system potassium uptake protein TrkH